MNTSLALAPELARIFGSACVMEFKRSDAVRVPQEKYVNSIPAAMEASPWRHNQISRDQYQSPASPSVTSSRALAESDQARHERRCTLFRACIRRRCGSKIFP